MVRVSGWFSVGSATRGKPQRLLMCNRPEGKSTLSVPVAVCTSLLKVYSAAMLRVVRDQNRSATLRSLTFSLGAGQTLPWAIGVLAAITSAATVVSWHVSLPDVSPPGVQMRSPCVLRLPGFMSMNGADCDDDLILDDGATVRPGWSRLWVAEDWCLQWSFLNVMPGLDDLRMSLMAL